MEVGSYIALAAATGGELLIKNAAPEHLRMVALIFERLGVRFEARGQDVFVPADQSLAIVPDAGGAIPSIYDAPWPGFPADLMSVAIVLASQSSGMILFHEKMFESRLYFVDKLIWLGRASSSAIPTVAWYRAIAAARRRGGKPRHPRRYGAPQRGSMRRGTERHRNIRQIDRGYEKIEEKLRLLGARIERVG